MQLEEEIASDSLNLSDSDIRRIEAAETKAVSAFLFQLFVKFSPMRLSGT